MTEEDYNKSFDLVTDEFGNFSLNSEPITKAGNYQIVMSASVCDGVNNFKTAQTNVLVEQKNNLITAQLENLKQVNYSGWLPSLIKVILFLLLIFGWFKYIIIKWRLKSIQKKAQQLTLASLFEKTNKDLSVLEKAKKKKTLTKTEEKALTSLRQELADIEKILNNK